MTTTPGRAEAAVDRALAELRRTRASLEELRAREADLAADRDAAILALVAGGWTYDAVAREAGLTRGRVGQIVHRGSA